MAIGVDFGGTFTDCVILEGKKMVFEYSIPTKEFNKRKLFNEIRKTGFSVNGACITGRKKALGIKFRKVNELESIALGAQFLSNEKEFISASVGTGTAIVSMKNG